MGASVRLRVIGKGALIRETKELDSAKVVQLTPETIVWGLEQALCVTPETPTTEEASIAALRHALGALTEETVAVVAHWGVFFSLLHARSLANCELASCTAADLARARIEAPPDP